MLGLLFNFGPMIAYFDALTCMRKFWNYGIKLVNYNEVIFNFVDHCTKRIFRIERVLMIVPTKKYIK